MLVMMSLMVTIIFMTEIGDVEWWCRGHNYLAIFNETVYQWNMRSWRNSVGNSHDQCVGRSRKHMMLSFDRFEKGLA